MNGTKGEQRELKRKGGGEKRFKKERGELRDLMGNGVQASKWDEEDQKGDKER